MSIDRMSIEEGFDVMNGEDATIAAAVAKARKDVVEAIELVVDAFRRGGRLIYVGAGTSGRLGVIDASECPPTFLSDPEMVQGIIAGGRDAMFRSIEAAEDSRETGAKVMDEKNVGCVVVVHDGRPVGIVTDRDLVLRVLRRARDPESVLIEEVMTAKVECVTADRDPLAVAVHMRQTGVRRLPVVDRDGRIVGIVAYDDLVRHVGMESREMADAVSQYPTTLGGA